MTLLMSQSHSRPATVARSSASSLTLSAALGEQLSRLYEVAQRSDYVFGTPVGPFNHDGRQHYLPRFVYFGPHTSEESPRLAFLAGGEARDLRPTLALLHLIEELATAPDLGQSLHVAFFPLVDVLGLQRAVPERRLADESWVQPASPEIDQLAREARVGHFHGFVRLESAADDAITLLVRTTSQSLPESLLFSSEDFEPEQVRWEIQFAPRFASGPLSLAEDLPFAPLDLTLRVPAAWSPDRYRRVVATILKRFAVRYRAFLAYGQHL